jgi:predicted amidohydrolase YtcJ
MSIANAKRVCSDRFSYISAPIGASGAQINQPLVAPPNVDRSGRPTNVKLVVLIALVCVISGLNEQARAADANSAAPDLIVTDGKIATLNSDYQFVQAMAIADGKITAVGTNPEIARLAGPQTKRISLNGKTVIPGLIETHCHSIGVGLNELRSPFVDLRNVAEIQKWVQARAKDVPKGRWIHTPRTEMMRLDEMRYPTRDELDVASLTHPVVMTSVRKHVLNTAAWKAIGVTTDSDEVEGAKIVRDKNGRPWLLSGGSQLLRDPDTQSPEFSAEEKLNALKHVHEVYSSVGITSIFERALNKDGWETYQDLRKSGNLNLRMTATIRQQFQSGDQVESFTKKLGLITGQGDNWLRVGPLKISVDGGIHWGTARLREPFGKRRLEFYKKSTLVDPDYQGTTRYSVSLMTDIFDAAHRLGWQMCCHVAGDQGVDRVLDAIDAVNKKRPITDRRFTLTHAYFPVNDAIQRCKRLGVCVDTQTYLFYRDARFINQIYGKDWSDRFIGIGEWYRGGIPVTINSDHMIGLNPDRAMNSFNPFLQLYITVSRRDFYGNVYGKHQRLSRNDALRCVTTNAAWQSFDEKRKGSLEVGKLADFVVLDRDYFTCPIEDIKKIKPLQTFVDGRVVFDRNSSD